MSENISQPWILARLALACSALVLALVAAVSAAKILTIARDAPPDERALRAERDSELAGAVMTLALLIELISALATVLVAHRLSGSLRGAMCAYGVLSSSPWGGRALMASAIAATLSSVWLGVRAVDTRIARGALARTLAKGAWVVAVAIAVDAVFSAVFLSSIDLRQHASCCSTGAADRARIDPAGHALTSIGLAPLVTCVTLAAVVAIALTGRRPSPSRAGIAVAFSASSAVVALFAARDVIAPFAFGSPAHRCVYCLLRVSEAGLSGPAFVVSWAVAASMTAFVAGAAWVGRRSAARAASDATVRAATTWWIAAWVVAMASAIVPVLTYRIQSGTWLLFGR